MDNLKIKKFFSLPKIVFVILGIIVLAELVYAVRVLTSPPPPAPLLVSKTIISKSAAKISLNTVKTHFSVNEVVPVSVMIDTGSFAVNGADVIVRFDPKILEATKAGLIKGKILDEYPLISVDASKGLISISGISSLNKSFKGIGQFALINFKVKLSGSTSLIIDFQKGSTTDSNLVESNELKDILEIVDNLELNIK